MQVAGLILHKRRHTSEVGHADWKHMTMLIKERPQRIHICGPLMHQAFPSTENGRARLLLDCLGLHETHLRLACRNDNRLGIGRIIFLPLHKGVHVLRCDKRYLVPKSFHLTGSKMRAAACLENYHAGLLLRQECGELLPRQLLAELDLPRSKGTMNLENCLCQINPDHHILISPSSSARGVEHHDLGTLRCRLRGGGNHSI